MATIAKRRVRLELDWNKDDPSNFSWRVIAWGYVNDDAQIGGEEELMAVGQSNTIARSTFKGLSGTQIINNAAAAATTALQALGSGAGGHSINDDDGD